MVPCTALACWRWTTGAVLQSKYCWSGTISSVTCVRCNSWRISSLLEPFARAESRRSKIQDAHYHSCSQLDNPCSNMDTWTSSLQQISFATSHWRDLLEPSTDQVVKSDQANQLPIVHHRQALDFPVLRLHCLREDTAQSLCCRRLEQRQQGSRRPATCSSGVLGHLKV